MYVINPPKVLKWASDNPATDLWLATRLDTLKNVLDNADLAPEKETITRAVRFISDVSGIILTPSEFSRLLNLYPYVKANLINKGFVDGVTDAQMGGQVLDVLADSLLGEGWPRGKDCDISMFIDLLRLAATIASSKLWVD